MAQGTDNLPPDASSRPTGVVTFKVFSNELDAESAMALLAANGIPCWLQADDCGGMLSALDAAQGVKLLGQATDAAAAKALLAAPPVAPLTPAAGLFPCAPSAEPTRSGLTAVSLLQIGAGIVVGILLCLLYQWFSRLGTHSYPGDINADGRVDENWIFRDGYLVHQTLDRNFDGQLDAWCNFDRNSRRLDSTADDNFDGVVDVWWRYTNGVLVSSSEDTDFNGTPDVTYFYKYDLCTSADWRPNGTNIVTLRQTSRHGVLTVEQRDTNWDGTFDLTIHFDAFQNPIVTNVSR